MSPLRERFCVKLGGCDYLTKPFPEERLSTAFQNCLEPQQPAAQNACLKQAMRNQPAPGGIVLQFEQFRQVYKWAQKLALTSQSLPQPTGPRRSRGR